MINSESHYQLQSKFHFRWIKIQCLLVVVFLFMLTPVSFAQGNIVDYFLKSPDAWDRTKKLIHKEPIKVIVTGGLDGLCFSLAELTEGDTVALVFIDTQKSEKLKGKASVEVIAVSALKAMDLDTLLPSLQKTGKLITLEDHNPYNGLASQVNGVVAQEGLSVLIHNMGVREYQLSGTSSELYAAAGLGSDSVLQACFKMANS